MNTGATVCLVLCSVALAQAFLPKQPYPDYHGKQAGNYCYDFEGRPVAPGESFYDGCNTCTCGEFGQPQICTLRACDIGHKQPVKPIFPGNPAFPIDPVQPIYPGPVDPIFPIDPIKPIGPIHKQVKRYTRKSRRYDSRKYGHDSRKFGHDSRFGHDSKFGYGSKFGRGSKYGRGFRRDD